MGERKQPIWGKGPYDRIVHRWYRDPERTWQWRRTCRAAKPWPADWTNLQNIDPLSDRKRCARCERAERSTAG